MCSTAHIDRHTEICPTEFKTTISNLRLQKPRLLSIRFDRGLGDESCTAIDQKNLRPVFAIPDHWHELCNLLSPTDRPSHIQPGEWTVTYACTCNRQRMLLVVGGMLLATVVNERSLCSGHRASWFQNCRRKRSPRLKRLFRSMQEQPPSQDRQPGRSGL